MKKWIFGFILAGLLGTNVWAADGSSGCGPGWYILKDNSLVSSFLRATTNGVLLPVVTIGMTVGTSNCTKHSIVEREKESLYFATHNFFELKRDIAKGQGSYLTAFSSTVGCPVKTKNYFANQLKNNFKQIYSQESIAPENMLKEVYKVILTDEKLTNECSLQIS